MYTNLIDFKCYHIHQTPSQQRLGWCLTKQLGTVATLTRKFTHFLTCLKTGIKSGQEAWIQAGELTATSLRLRSPGSALGPDPGTSGLRAALVSWPFLGAKDSRSFYFSVSFPVAQQQHRPPCQPGRTERNLWKPHGQNRKPSLSTEKRQRETPRSIYGAGRTG